MNRIMRGKIVLVVIFCITLLTCTQSYSEVVKYAPDEMNYPVTPEEAIEIAEKWSQDESLKLELTGVNKTTVNNVDYAEYVLKPQDKKQVFLVDCNTGNVIFWMDYAASGTCRKNAREDNDHSRELPVTEINELRRQFLISRYPGFIDLHMQIADPEDDECGYVQLLSNGVRFHRNSVICAADPRSGMIYGYEAIFSATPTYSTKYNISSDTAEKAAVAYGRTIDLIVTGQGDDIVYTKPQSVFVLKNRGVWLDKDDKGAEHLKWKIDVIIEKSPGYTLDMFNAELIADGINNSSCETIYVDANTGYVLGHDAQKPAIYRTPTTQSPSFSQSSGTFQGSTSIIISCPTSGSTIRYTTDGTTPMMNSTLYTEPIKINKTTTLKARAWAPEHRSSEVTTSLYTVE